MDCLYQLLLIIGNKQFGISSSLQNICSLILPKTRSVFKGYDFKLHDWKIYFVIGIAIGGFFASNVYINNSVNYLPANYYSFWGVLTLFIGGLLVGFGTRYANGCTSGHSITGLSMLKLSSLIATIAFFIGGLFYTFIL